MPNPFGWVDDAASILRGLGESTVEVARNPEMVVSDALDTGSLIWQALDRPRAAVKASQVESQNAGSMPEAIMQALMGAGQGFANPEQYPAEGFLEGIFTDPLVYGGIGQAGLRAGQQAGRGTVLHDWLRHLDMEWMRHKNRLLLENIRRTLGDDTAELVRRRMDEMFPVPGRNVSDAFDPRDPNGASYGR